jgi:hypothetical protein
MTRFVVDAGAVLRLASEGVEAADAFVTLEAELVRSVEGIVATASTDALL